MWRDRAAQIFEYLHAFQFSPVNGDAWLGFGGVWGCLEQGLSLPFDDNQVEESTRLGEAVIDYLEVVFFEHHEGAVICEKSFKDEFLFCLCFCWQATEVEQRAVSSVSDVDIKIYVFHSMVQYLSKEEVEEL